MDYKQLIKTQLDLLKNMGFGRRRLERELEYGDKYIDQALSRGGNEALLNALVAFKNRIEDGEEANNHNNNLELNDDPVAYSREEIIELQKQVIADLRAEKLKLMNDLDELKMKNNRLELQLESLLANSIQKSKRTRSA